MSSKRQKVAIVVANMEHITQCCVIDEKANTAPSFDFFQANDRSEQTYCGPYLQLVSLPMGTLQKWQQSSRLADLKYMDSVRSSSSIRHGSANANLLRFQGNRRPHPGR